MPLGYLRQRLLEMGLRDHVPLAYYGPDGDVVGAIDALLEFAESKVIPGPSDAADAAEDRLQELRDDLHALEAWVREETTDGALAHTAVEMTARVGRVLQAEEDRADPAASGLLALHLPRQRVADHAFRRFPHGVEWCERCGAVLRRGETLRYFQPGAGETDVMPPCLRVPPPADHMVQKPEPTP